MEFLLQLTDRELAQIKNLASRELDFLRAEERAEERGMGDQIAFYESLIDKLDLTSRVGSLP